jgi:hypothetical protein
MSRAISQANSYADKVIKLIPAEWVSAYVAIKGILDSVHSSHQAYYVTIAVLLTLLPFYLKRVLGVESTAQIIVTTVSFLVWVFSLGGDHVGAISWYEPYQGSITLILWTLFVPIIVDQHRRNSRASRIKAA